MEYQIEILGPSHSKRDLRLLHSKWTHYGLPGKWSLHNEGRRDKVDEPFTVRQYYVLQIDIELDDIHKKLVQAFVGDFIRVAKADQPD